MKVRSRKLILEEIRPLVDDLQLDSGRANILAVKRGKGQNLPRVMLAAHMDEVGFMLTHRRRQGNLSFCPNRRD